MYSEEEILYDENNLFSSDEDHYTKEELDIHEVYGVFNKIIEEFSHSEPMLSSISCSDIFDNYDHNYSKNSEKYYDEKTIFELSRTLDNTIQNFLVNYDDTNNFFYDTNQYKIYSKIVGSFDKYYVLN